MFFQEDHTYTQVRKRSLEQWLEDMEKHEDLAVRDGVPLVRSYIETLYKENERLKSENELKAKYLKKIAGKQ